MSKVSHLYEGFRNSSCRHAFSSAISGSSGHLRTQEDAALFCSPQVPRTLPFKFVNVLNSGLLVICYTHIYIYICTHMTYMYIYIYIHILYYTCIGVRFGFLGMI